MAKTEGVKLTPKQARFVLEYTKDFNGTQAAMRAGYSQKTASIQAFDLLRKPNVQEAVQKSCQKTAAKLEITRERLIAEYAKLAFSNMGEFAKWNADRVDLIDSETLTPDQTAAVAEIGQTVTKDGGSIRFKLHDKKGALDSLAKMCGFDKSDGDDGPDDTLAALLLKADTEAKRATSN